VRDLSGLRQRIELAASAGPADGARGDVEDVIDRLSRGELRVASKDEGGAWEVHAWVKQAILLYFRLSPLVDMDAGVYRWHDKVPIRTDLGGHGVRTVPPSTVRRGAYIERGAILMPSYVNVGAWVGAGTMVDTWATVGSCAQIGRNVHLSGGVGIGGVLEPPGARPVIIEDDCFVGSRAIVVEGVHVDRGAVLGANVVLTASTPIVDVSGATPLESRGYVPPGSVVIPGVREKKFPAGVFSVPCALIVGRRSESTDRKTSLEHALRGFEIAV
jgi:2,3,4,5-tetrahydropyridine-2-carboxylate N-succinyltransferase